MKLKEKLNKIKIKDITAGTDPIRSVGSAWVIRKVLKLINLDDKILNLFNPVNHNDSLCLILEVVDSAGVDCLPFELAIFKRVYKDEFINFLKLLYSVDNIKTEYYQNKNNINCEIFYLTINK